MEAVPLMSLLIERGANIDVTSRDSHYYSPISIAIDNDKRKALRLLIESGANFSQDSQAVELACQSQKGWALRRLLRNGLDPNVVLQHVASNPLNCHELLKVALSHHADSNYCVKDFSSSSHPASKGMSVLQLLAQQLEYPNSSAPMILLLKHNADINFVSEHDTFKTALEAALHARKFDKTQFLLENGARIDQRANDIVTTMTTTPLVRPSREDFETLLRQYSSGLEVLTSADE
ncbi:putative ankyrin repeat-containing domain superfamily [Septoria linicola]|nr:putative ankyrin repeat-containing domain superfamily [Septoria linicola]